MSYLTPGFGGRSYPTSNHAQTRKAVIHLAEEHGVLPSRRNGWQPNSGVPALAWFLAGIGAMTIAVLIGAFADHITNCH